MKVVVVIVICKERSMEQSMLFVWQYGKSRFKV